MELCLLSPICPHGVHWDKFVLRSVAECGYNVTNTGIYLNIIQNYGVCDYDQNFLKFFNWKWYICVSLFWDMAGVVHCNSVCTCVCILVWSCWSAGCIRTWALYKQQSNVTIMPQLLYLVTCRLPCFKTICVTTVYIKIKKGKVVSVYVMKTYGWVEV